MTQSKSKSPNRAGRQSQPDSLRAQIRDLRRPNLGPITHTHPEKVRFWHETKNTLSPDEVSYGSRKVVYWQCDTSPRHEWKMSVSSFCSRRQNCEVCDRYEVPESGRLSRFVEIAAEWHPTGNGLLTTDLIRTDSKRSVWWL